VVLLCSLTLPTAAKAGVVLNSTNFPDANFRAYVSTNTGVAVNGTISDVVISKQTYFNCYNKSIASLQGIEYFTALETLYCRGNQLTALDVSHNIALTSLNCSGNQLAALDVSHNTALESLDCYGNKKIKSLDVSINTALKQLDCSSDSITALDVTHNTALESLSCRSNQLTTLDITHNALLTRLLCSDNKLTSLDVTKNAALKTLWSDDNNLMKLDVTHNTKLSQLFCVKDKLTTLDLSKCTELTEFYCNYNQLAELDLSQNTKLNKIMSCVSNSRTIKVYKYTRSAANGGGIGYYVPLTAQAATTDNPATKALATLIDDAGQSGDPAFDISRVVADSWGHDATLGTFNGTQVLFLNAKYYNFYYKYKSEFTGRATQWITDYSAVAPEVGFTLQWAPSQVVTSVDGVEDNDVSVYTVNSAINVGGSFDGNVNVYNLRGQQVYCGTDSEIAVPAGMYIVKVNGKAHKVLVR
jgi:hypothetical protein